MRCSSGAPILVTRAESGWVRGVCVVAWQPYVEEDQEAQGPAPSFEGEPRKATQHGSRLIAASPQFS